MHNPSHPFPLPKDLSLDAVLRELAALAMPACGVEKGSRAFARRIATLLHAALPGTSVHVEIEDPETGETIVANDGDDGHESGLSLEQWRALLAPILKRNARERLQVVSHPARAGKLKLLIARIEAGRGGHIAVASSDPAFAPARDELLVQMASHQVAIALENWRTHGNRSLPGTPAGESALQQQPALQQQIAQLVTEIDAGIQVLDREWRFTYVNERAATIFGRTRAELIGVSLWQRFPHVVGDEAWRRLHDCMERRVGVRFELRYADRHAWFDVQARPLGDGVSIVCTDITARKELEEQQARMLSAEREARAEAELLRDLGSVLNTELDVRALLQQVTDTAAAAVGAEFGAFFYNSVNEHGESHMLHALSGVPRDTVAKFPLPRNTEVFASTFRGERVVRSDDIKQDRRDAESAPYHGVLARHLPITSYLAAPVRSRSGEVLGGLICGHAEPARFSERHERVLAGVAAQAAVAIDNARLFDAAREQAERLRVTHAQAPMGVVEADFSGRFQMVNERFCQIVGYTRAELLRLKFNDITHPDDLAIDVEKFRALRQGEIESYQREKRYIRKDGRVIWVRLSVGMVRDAGGIPRYALGMLEDITARHHADERNRFLVEASKRLAASLNYRETLAYLTRLAVPAVADWCAVDMIEPDGSLGRLAAAHVDNAKLELAEQLGRRYPPTPADERGPYKVVATGASEFVATITDDMLVQAAKDAEHLAQLRALQLRSYICVPLVARERVLGTITFVQAGSERRFEDADRAFAEELARRAAIAIDNTLLFEAEREQAARLKATYHRAAIGIVEIGLDGRFISANDRFCAITGYSQAALSQLHYHDLMHPADFDAHDMQYRDLQSGKIDSYRLEQRLVRKDGGIVWVRLTGSLVHDGQGRPHYGIAAVEDITERRRAQIVIQGQRKALEQMARREPLAAVLETLVATFDQQSMAGGLSMVLLLAPDGRGLRAGAVGRLPAEWVGAPQDLQVGPNLASCGLAVRAGQSVFVSDIGSDARWEASREPALRLGFRAAWSLCLRSSANRVLGSFDILFREPRSPSEEELRFVELIVDTAAVAIERYEDEKSLHLQAQVLSRIHDAVVMLDLEGRVLRWNEGAERMFGYAAADALGKHLSTICVSRGEYAWLAKYVMAPVKREGRFERVVRLRDRSGRALHAHMSLSLLRDQQGTPTAMVGYLLDVTERVEAEQELGVRLRQQAAVARLGQTALSNADLQTVFDEVVRVVAQTLDVELCKVLELLPNGAELLLRAGVGWRDGLVGKGTVSSGPESQGGYTLRSNEPVVVEDLRSETRFSGPAVLLDHGVVSGMSVVIQGEAQHPYGVLGAHSKSERRFTAHDVNFLRSVAHILATAIQRKRFEEAMRSSQGDLERRVDERTAELARANQSLRDEVVERMGVENALRDSEAQYRMLFERNPLSAWVFDINSRNILAANETAVWQYGYTRDEFLRMTINDLHPAEEATRALDYAGQFPPETAYIGVWKHRKQDETVIDVEVFVYEVLFQGRWARLMLAHDITERRRTEQEFRLMETITRAVSEAGDVDTALYAVLHPVCQSTGWVLGEAWLPTLDQRHMRASRAWYGSAAGMEDFRAVTLQQELGAGEGLIGRAWTMRQPVWIADVTTEDAFWRKDAARAAGLRAGIAFPVLAENDVVAILAFFLRESRVEDEHQIKLVSTIGAQVGIAIQRKRAEERLRESEERFRLLVEGGHDYAIFMLDSDGRVASWNKGAERLKGYTVEEALGQPLSLFYTPEDVARRQPQRSLAQAAAEGACESEGWRVRNGGERFWASVTITALRGTGGELRGFIKVTRDITERQLAQERLKESEARLARAQEFSLLMVAHIGLDGRWLKVPPMLCATLAYREEELLQLRFQDVTHADDFGPEWAECERLVRGAAKSFDIEKRFLRRDGKTIWVYQNTSIVLDAEDRPLHFLTFIRDITPRKEAEEQLRRSEIQLSEAQRLAHLGSWEWEVATGKLEWSDELYRIYGLPPGIAVTYETYREHIHPEDRARAEETIAAALATRQPFTLEERIVRADGETRHLLSHAAVVTDPRGDAVRLVGVCLDITERKRAEERLREYAHRLQSLSTRLLEAQETERRSIARELHDQIGQDLSVIKINLQALERMPGTAAIGPQIEETIRVVEGVLQTARNLSVELRPSMLDDLGLTAALRWYLDRQAQRAGVALYFAADMQDTRINPMIETACFRLAQEALTNVLRHAGARHVQVTLQQSKLGLELRVVDDGRGFEVDVARSRAVSGESFGILGMEERALLAGGELEITSSPGQGTTVVARFPLNSTSGHNHEYERH